MTLLRTLAFTVVASLSPALAQGVTVWGGVGTEAFFSPQATLGLSATAEHLGRVAVDVRGLGSLIALSVGSDPALAYSVTADVLFSGNGSGLNVYGGPSVGVLGDLSGPSLAPVWLFGGVGGIKGSFGSGSYGWFAEARARIAYSGTQTSSSFNESLPFLPVAGLAVGVTYRF
ncbi:MULTISPECIES: hypothetical protein [Deinococcus]|uniref:Outer membrane protein beta-barrel domain-containing protein n=1 Tax=Deinococcus rufus TaxID=2136097 RepID=A0ABV7ZF97_9DEIO|nr:hypothetical protein [Deinococcus sp. AB2017081]WQE96888.1 hypothetical protein U2P90_08290 [Deinococcus sp. AB2017081]